MTHTSPSPHSSPRISEQYLSPNGNTNWPGSKRHSSPLPRSSRSHSHSLSPQTLPTAITTSNPRTEEPRPLQHLPSSPQSHEPQSHLTESHLQEHPARKNEVNGTGTQSQIIPLIKFINHIWRRIEKREAKLDQPSTLLETIENKLQHLSEGLEYLRREVEGSSNSASLEEWGHGEVKREDRGREHSHAHFDGKFAKERESHQQHNEEGGSGREGEEVKTLLGKLSIDLNLLDELVTQPIATINKSLSETDHEHGHFSHLLSRLDDRTEDLGNCLENLKAGKRHSISGPSATAMGVLRAVTTGWHHVHWADLVEVRYPNHVYQHPSHPSDQTTDLSPNGSEKEKEQIKIDLRRDEGYDDDCITVYVRFQDAGGYGTKGGCGNWSDIEVVAGRETSLGEVKRGVRERIGVEVCRQLFSFRGVLLDNDLTLRDCGLENESTLNGVIISKHLAEGSRRTSWL